LFCHIEQSSEARRVLIPQFDEVEATTMNIDDVRRHTTDELFDSFEAMHKQVVESRDADRKRAIMRHNKATNVQEANFEVGDFVLVGIACRNKVHKLALRWQGPARVIDLDPHNQVYHVQMMGELKTLRIHADRLRFYSDHLLEVTEELTSHVDQERERYYVIEELRAARRQGTEGVMLQVKWVDYDDLTWEPAAVISKDAPEMYYEFTNALEDQDLKQELKRHMHRAPA